MICMEKTEILEKIREAEIKVEEDIKNAEEQKKNTILKAKMDARRIVEDAENEASKVREKILNSIKDQIKIEKDKIRQERLEEIAEIEKKGKENIEKAVDYLFNEFLRMVEHA
ncbi:ATP synthase archaeal subunit H [Archaeoglobales archaeon]|nr:MAG: ATP synthase archaeal subunit H [Archaeoglobales archaeon]